MNMRLDTVIGLITIITSVCATFIFIWKLGNAVATMQADLRSQLNNSDHERQLNDMRLEHLQDKLELGFNGVRERFEHFSQRSRTEYQQIDARMKRAETCLQKNFKEFES